MEDTGKLGRKPRVVSIFGTRPEATKMAPVVHAIQQDSDLEGMVIVSGQHREQLDSAIQDLDIPVDFDLNLMQKNQALADLVAAVTREASLLLRQLKPDLVLVHGDTGTTCGGALAAFYENIPLAHIEAGLRSGSMQEPFPEEGIRKVADTFSSILFAPTDWVAQNLFREGFSAENVIVTGNTAIDTLRCYIDKARSLSIENLHLRSDLRLITVTAHRRVSFGDSFRQLCLGLRHIIDTNENVEIEALKGTSSTALQH